MAEKTLTLVEFSTPADHAKAQALCRKLGFADSHAYCTSSDIPGLYCLPLHAGQSGVVIVKTSDFGFVALQTFED